MLATTSCSAVFTKGQHPLKMPKTYEDLKKKAVGMNRLCVFSRSLCGPPSAKPKTMRNALDPHGVCIPALRAHPGSTGPRCYLCRKPSRAGSIFLPRPLPLLKI